MHLIIVKVTIWCHTSINISCLHNFFARSRPIYVHYENISTSWHYCQIVKKEFTSVKVYNAWNKNMMVKYQFFHSESCATTTSKQVFISLRQLLFLWFEHVSLCEEFSIKTFSVCLILLWSYRTIYLLITVF